MKEHFHRRDFLKLAGLLPLSLAAPRALRTFGASHSLQPAQKNILVIVFDAFSADNISFYGYGRETTPNLARLASRSIVYHNHYSAGSFTTSGTASLLTGVLPWTHRALQGRAAVADNFATRSLFSTFPGYYRIAYTHNGWANVLLKQFQGQLEELVPSKSLFLRSYAGSVQTIFENDSDTAEVGWTRALDIRQEGNAYSLLLSHLYAALEQKKDADLKQLFPRGLPSNGNFSAEFILETAIDWVADRLSHLPQPFLGYFHFLPPHGPYNTSLRFYEHFKGDSLQFSAKPAGLFSANVSDEALSRKRTDYDEYLLYVDEQFGRLYDALEASGLLQDTWLILTSDHGELNERGISGHLTEALYQPLVRVPLLIFEPGRQQPVYIEAPTSAIDLLPTLTYLAGQPLPDWAEGSVLPPFADSAWDPGRSIYAIDAKHNDMYAPLAHASLMLIKDRYKLVRYMGYADQGIDDLVQLYDIQSDPRELVDLSASEKRITAELLDELKSKLAAANRPYL